MNLGTDLQRKKIKDWKQLKMGKLLTSYTS